MADKMAMVQVEYSGQPCLIKGGGIKAQEIKKGSVLEMSKETYESEFKNDTRYKNVSRETSEKRDQGYSNKKDIVSDNKKV